ncbi:hypothetical protein FRC00_007956 [Tulasnella sp. 408]|nr:hypothetical protein FRC00_007956 [Tulasnella sp. 408]
MKFKRDAARWRKEMGDLEDAIFGLATANMLSDNPKVQSSFMFKRIQDLENNHEEGSNILHLRDDINYCGLQIFFEATLQTFIRAMTLFPSVQKKAQAEIDRVIGPSRLPTFKDQPDLPYLHAVMLETLRWSPVVSIGTINFGNLIGDFRETRSITQTLRLSTLNGSSSSPRNLIHESLPLVMVDDFVLGKTLRFKRFG